MKTFEIGKLIHGVTYQEYHDFGVSINALRSSHLGKIKKSPAHLQDSIINPQEETEALRQGKLIHSAFENPEKFLDNYTIEPVFEGRTQKGELTTSANCKEVKDKKANWLAGLKAGTLVISDDDATMITGMINAVQNHRIAKALLSKGVSEVSGWVKCPETGLILQFRPDRIHDFGYFIDLKSTKDASEASFTKEIFSEFGWFYVLQAAHYSYCAKLMGLTKNDSFTFIPIEKKRPYGVNVFALSEAHIDVGERWRKNLTRKYAECLASGKWPAYEEKAINPQIPGYVSAPMDEGFYDEEEI
jgi:hypothetical protein